MATEFRFPDVGEGITEGKLVKWLVEVGDTVAKDQSLCEVETDKAIVELPSPENGSVLKILVEEGHSIQVGKVLIVIGRRGESVPHPKAETNAVLPAENKKAAPVALAPFIQTNPAAVLAMPHTRKLARILGVDISKVKGSGPGGKVTDADVQKYKENAVPSVSFTPSRHGGETQEAEHGTVEVLPLIGMRRAIAEKLSESHREMVHVTLMDEVDVEELISFLEKEKTRLAAHNVKLTFLPFIIKASIVALTKYPIFNSEIDVEKKEIRIKHFFNVGIAVDTPEGLVVPVVRDCDKKSITEIAIEIADMAKEARDRKISLEQIKGSSFSITNYGSVGARFATPIINPPNTAILGVGRISDRAVVRDGKVVVRQMLPLSFGFDHRIADGAVAAEFLSELMRHLSD